MKVFSTFLFLLLASFTGINLAQGFWEQQTSGTNQSLLGVSFADNFNGTVVGSAGTILQTTDGGANWSPQSSGITTSLNGVFLTSTQTGFAVGNNGVILKTINGGSVWDPQTSTTTENLQAVTFFDSDSGIAVGDNGAILLTTDGGVTWNNHSAGNYSLYDVEVIDGQTWMACGLLALLRSTDGGRNWNEVTIPGSNTIFLKSISFADANTGFAVGSLEFFRTTDGGLSWDSVYAVSQAFDEVRSVFCINDTLATAVGTYGANAGVVFGTTDKGNTWQFSASFGVSKLEAVDFVNTVFGWAVGYSGAILHTPTITGVADENIGPDFYYLSQNYPNPFNPSTNIRFQIPKLSFVNLKVYDVLGREVESLINEEKSAGSYEVEFNSNNLTSGIYFYKIQAGEFSQTKKMILLK